MSKQWLRVIKLYLVGSSVIPPEGVLYGWDSSVPGNNALDLSNLHIKFVTHNADVATPGNASIRIYNLSADTLNRIIGLINVVDGSPSIGEYGRLLLEAGYKGASGLIFDGTIWQYRVGREDSMNTYLDLLIRDADIVFNQPLQIQQGKGWTPESVVNEIAAKLKISIIYAADGHYIIPNPRGIVGFGIPAAMLNNIAYSTNSGWSIQNNTLIFKPLNSYVPGEAIELNTQTGMIGIPEQTSQGIKVKCLLNPKIRIGSLIKLNFSEINRLLEKDPSSPTGTMYNSRQPYQMAPLLKDGLYMAFLVEHEGDTRGKEWYTNIIALAVKATTQKVQEP